MALQTLVRLVSNNTPGFLAVVAALEETHYQRPAPVDLPGVRVDEYAPSPACCLPLASAAPRMTFGSSIGLLNANLPEVVSGDQLEIGSLWSLDGVPLHRYSVTFRIFDSQGSKVAQADEGFAPLADVCQQVAIPVVNLSPGNYEARLAVYNRQTGERLVGADNTSGQSGDLLPLQTFAIAST